MNGKRFRLRGRSCGALVCVAFAWVGVSLVITLHPTAAQQTPEQQNVQQENRKQQQIQAEIKRLLQLPLPAVVPSSKTATPLAPEIPSLWWTHDQFGSKLVTDWHIYPSPQAKVRHVRLQVRSGIWARFSYAERYAVVNNFGTELRATGYQLIVLDRQNAAIAAYLCNLPHLSPIDQSENSTDETSQPPCHLWLSPRYPNQSF